MKIDVVTSCSREGFERYGLKFLDTFHRYWPVEVGLYVVSEDNLILPPSILHGERRVFFVPLNCASKPVQEFYDRHANNRRAQGLDSPMAKNGNSDFRLNAVKFSKKVFAINLALTRTPAQRLIWLDADVYTHAQVPFDFIANFPPRGTAYALSCLDRGRLYHSECGFVAYNLEHQKTRPFITEFQRLYTSDEVFKLKEWHDSYVFDWLRKRDGITAHCIPHKSNGHPFVFSELGRYMDHMKGARKQHGASHDHPRFKRPHQPAPMRPRRQPRWMQK